MLLCRLVDSHCAGPDFVNFNNSVRTGQIVGLAPEAIYQVEVIAYTAEEHVSSDLVTVNTRRLGKFDINNYLMLLQIPFRVLTGQELDCFTGDLLQCIVWLEA